MFERAGSGKISGDRNESESESRSVGQKIRMVYNLGESPIVCRMDWWWIVVVLSVGVLIGISPGKALFGDERPSLSAMQASNFARLALKGVNREYPNKLDHIMGGSGDVQSPRTLHPAFYGCYDWHSSVHGHWMLARLLQRFPGLPEAAAIRAVFADHFSVASLQAEAAYFARPESRTFERTYGWAWLLKLTQELNGWDDPDAKGVGEETSSRLPTPVASRYVSFFPKQLYPIRTGVHPNTAFGLALAYDYAASVHDDGPEKVGRGPRPSLLRQRCRRPGAVGAGRVGLLLAQLARGRPDAPGLATRGVSRLVHAVLAGNDSGRAQRVIHPGRCAGPDRPATGPP